LVFLIFKRGYQYLQLHLSSICRKDKMDYHGVLEFLNPKNLLKIENETKIFPHLLGISLF
jgi:hypothetical protein